MFFSPRYPSLLKTTRTPENPESPSCPAPALTVTPPPQSPSPPPPTPRTTRCSGGRACSGRDGWAGRGVGDQVEPKVARAAQRSGSASRGWICSGAQNDKSSIHWCERGWNIWAFLQLGLVSFTFCLALAFSNFALLPFERMQLLLLCILCWVYILPL